MPTKSKSSSTIGLKDDDSGEMVFDENLVASRFNTFFCNIADKLVKKLSHKDFNENGLIEYYKDKNVRSNSFVFDIVSEKEVEKLLLSLNVSKSTGCDKIPARFVKDATDVICSPLTYMINLSLRKCTVPSDFKMARVVPLFKKGDRSSAGNYRPVAILPVISKIYEKIVYKQFYNYLNENDLIYKYQSGFRSSFSTDSALTYMCDKIRYNMDDGYLTGLVLLDLQKAFDTVNHDILLKKLSAVGADDSVVKWFSSYVSDRKQVVQINNITSQPMSTSCGVPQGSILGPLLFIIYVNDMSRAINSDSDLYLYADDSAILVKGKDVHAIEDKLSSDLGNVKLWLEENKLSLHLGKTESILFASKSKLKKTSKLNVKVDDVVLQSKNSVKYLGATIEQDLSGDTMGYNAVKKVNTGLKFLYRQASFLDLKEKKLLCYSMLQSCFDFACNVWYRSLKKSIKLQLQTAQNKMIRFILGYHPRRHLYFDDFKQLGFLDVESRVDFLSLNTMYNICNHSAPMYMIDLIPRFLPAHSTRRSQLSFIVSSDGTHGSLSFKCNSVKLWNKLPNVIKLSDSKDKFKQKCKSYLMCRMKEKEEDDFVRY